ncbi:MAG: response regulator [Pseudomonadota bacterium]
MSLIVLDLTMPRLSGEDTFREIKRIEPDLPVLLTSGYTEHDVMSSFVEQDLAGFIQKPFTTVDLLPHLRRILD